MKHVNLLLNSRGNGVDIFHFQGDLLVYKRDQVIISNGMDECVLEHGDVVYLNGEDVGWTFREEFTAHEFHDLLSIPFALAAPCY